MNAKIWIKMLAYDVLWHIMVYWWA